VTLKNIVPIVDLARSRAKGARKRRDRRHPLTREWLTMAAVLGRIGGRKAVSQSFEGKWDTGLLRPFFGLRKRCEDAKEPLSEKEKETRGKM